MNAKKIVHLTVLMFICITTVITITTTLGENSSNGLHIIVTFPNLVYDVKPLLCKGDVIYSIAPIGIDPHEYQLTPSNIDELRKADIVISTGHAPFEKSIEEKLGKEIKGEIIIIPKIPNIKILTNPATGNPNYHMPIYDPENYKVFIKYVVNILAKKRPECANYYNEKASEIISKIDSLIKNTPKLSVKAVADTPTVQYATSWLNVELKYLLIKEHEVPASPKDIENVLKAIEKGEIELVIINNPPRQKASQMLKEVAEEKNLPILYVPIAFSEGSFLEKLSEISKEAWNISETISKISSSSKAETPNTPSYELLIPIVLAIITVAFIIIKLRR